MFRKLFDFFIFSSLFIAGCAMIMVHQANQLLDLRYDSHSYLLFVFFSTICSYNFHWYLTPATASEMIRVKWTQRNKKLHIILIITGGIGACVFALQFLEYWLWLSGAVVLTFLYTAPKIPWGVSNFLKRIAVGKTLFLSFVWTYVTTVLPIVFGNIGWHAESLLFCASRFFLIYAICIIFDFRDREQDKLEGIKSMITYFNEKGIDRLFYLSLLLFLVSTAALYFFQLPFLILALLFIPGLLAAMLYPYAKKHFSDYLYYFVLDGLMMLSALFTSFLSF